MKRSQKPVGDEMDVSAVGQVRQLLDVEHLPVRRGHDTGNLHQNRSKSHTEMTQEGRIVAALFLEIGSKGEATRMPFSETNRREVEHVRR